MDHVQLFMTSSLLRTMDRLDEPMKTAQMSQDVQRTYVVRYFGGFGRWDDVLASTFRRETSDEVV